jgi:hypothetical protein
MSDQSVCIVVIPIKRFLRFISNSLSLSLSLVCVLWFHAHASSLGLTLGFIGAS